MLINTKIITTSVMFKKRHFKLTWLFLAIHAKKFKSHNPQDMNEQMINKLRIINFKTLLTVHKIKTGRDIHFGNCMQHLHMHFELITLI